MRRDPDAAEGVAPAAPGPPLPARLLTGRHSPNGQDRPFPFFPLNPIYINLCASVTSASNFVDGILIRRKSDETDPCPRLLHRSWYAARSGRPEEGGGSAHDRPAICRPCRPDRYGGSQSRTACPEQRVLTGCEGLWPDAGDGPYQRLQPIARRGAVGQSDGAGRD